MKGTKIIIGMDEHQKAFFTGLSAFIDAINKELSKEYSQEPLGKHIKVLGGYAFKSSEYKKEGVPIIRISDFNNEKIDLSGVKYYEEKIGYDRYQLFEGDIIIALTGGTIGKLGIVQKGLGKLYLNQRVGKFSVLRPKEFYDKYVYWLARGVQEKVKSFGYGGAQPNISGSQIEQIEFSIPNKKEQEKIVEFLEDLKNNEIKGKEYFHKETEDKIIHLLKIIRDIITAQNLQIQNIKFITNLRQSILQEAVQGKLVPQDPKEEPASELLKKIKVEKEKLIQEKKIKKQKPLPEIQEDEIPYELPKGWEWCRLGEIQRYIQRGPSAKYSNESSIQIINQKCIHWNRLLLEHTKCYSKKLIERLEDFRLLKEGDLLVNSTGTGTIGRAFLIKSLEGNYIADSHVTVLRPFDGIFQEYVKYFFQSPRIQNFINHGGVGGSTNQIELSKTIVSNFLFPLPPLSEQKRIVEKVDKLMVYCDELGNKIIENKKNAERLMGAVLRESFENE